VVSNTGTSVQSNELFSTGGPVALAVGVLNTSVWNTGVGMSYVAVTTQIAGSPTSYTALLEGSFDGITWSTVDTVNNVNGETQWSNNAVMFSQLRLRCTAVSGGTSPTINAFITVSQQPFVGTVTGNSMKISEGWSSPVSHFANAGTTNTGTVADFATSRSAITFGVTAGAGVSAGAVTLLGSVDGVTFVTLTAAAIIGGSGATISNGVLTFTAPGTVLVSLGANTAAIRWTRADITTNFTGGTASAKSQAF
jgi:hypothetical protein